MFIQNALVASAGEGGGGPSPSGGYDITNLTPTATSNYGLLSLYEASASANTQATGQYMSPDGLYYFVADSSDVAIYRYTLSTAFDIDTATLTQTKLLWNFSTLGYLGDIYFKSDGTELYATNYYLNSSTSVSGIQSIFRYTLSNPWNISTATLTTTTVADFYLLGPLTTISLSTNGDKLFLGTGHDNSILHVASFSLSTAWDISTTSLGTTTPVRNLSGLNTIGDGVTFKGIANITSSSNPGGTYDTLFNSTGTTAWFLTTDDVIRQYTLGTAYDLKTLSYTNKSLSVTAQNTAPRGIAWGDSGSKFYMVGVSGGDILYEYSASTAYDISTVTYSNKSFDLNAAASALTNPFGINWKPDGTRFFVICASSEAIYQFDCSTAWDISTASYSNGFVSVKPPFSFASYAFDMDPNGLFFIVAGYSSYRVTKWPLSTAWDLTTAGSYSTTDRYDWKLSIKCCKAVTSYAYVVRFLDSGSKLYICDPSDFHSIVNLSTSYALNTASWTSPSSNYLAAREITSSIAQGNFVFNESGTDAGKKLVFLNSSNYDMYVLTLSTAWDISSGTSIVGPLNITVRWSPRFITASAGATNNGEYYYTADGNNQMSYQYKVTTPWTTTPSDYSEVRPSQYWARPSELQSWNGWTYIFGDNGHYLYEVDNGDYVNRYTLTTNYNLSTIGTTATRIRLNTQDTFPIQVYFKPDGLTMYMLGRTSDTVYQYTLSTAWDQTTATYANKSFYIGSQENNPYAMTFSANGNYLFILGNTQDDIFKYSLSTAWDISTASYSNNFLNTGENDNKAVIFSPDGTKVIAGGGTNGSLSSFIKQWTLSTAWDLSTATLNVDKKPLLPPNCLIWNDDGSKLFMGAGYAAFNSGSNLPKAELWEYDASA
jgi:sugar lactone lactonase YvrE